MAKWFKVRDRADGTISFACEGSDQPPAYDPLAFEITELPGPPTEQDVIIGNFKGSVAEAEAWACKKVEDDAAGMCAKDTAQARRQLAIQSAWQEVQRLKLAQLVPNGIPADLTERRKQYPMLMALVALSGATLAQVATAVENRYWDRVRRFCLAEAKLILGRDQVRAETTIEAKLAAAAAILWAE